MARLAAAEPAASIWRYWLDGFGYRRCADEWFTIEVFKNPSRHIHDGDIVFQRMDVEDPDLLQADASTVIEDGIAFPRG